MRGTDLREPSRLLLLQIKAEAGICSVLKSSSSAEVRVGLAGGAGKQEAGVRIAVFPELVPSPLAERFTCVGSGQRGSPALAARGPVTAARFVSAACSRLSVLFVSAVRPSGRLCVYTQPSFLSAQGTDRSPLCRGGPRELPLLCLASQRVFAAPCHPFLNVPEKRWSSLRSSE